MPITITNPICDFDGFDCAVEAKPNRIYYWILARLGKASGECNTNRVPYKGEKHRWLASNQSRANEKLVIKVRNPFVTSNDRRWLLRMIVSTTNLCLKLAHNKGCASYKIPMLSSSIFVKNGSNILQVRFSKNEAPTFMKTAQDSWCNHSMLERPYYGIGIFGHTHPTSCSA